MQLTGKNGSEDKNNAVTIFQILAKCSYYLPMFLATLVLALVIGWLYTHFASPMYESTAKVLINDERKGTEDSQILESFNVLSTKKIIENESEIFQSRTLLYDVVKMLALYAPITRKEGFKKTPVYEASPVRIEISDIKQLKETKNVPLSFDWKRMLVLVNGRAYETNKWATTPYGLLKFTLNKRYQAAPDNNVSFSLINPKKVVNDLQARLTITSDSKTSILKLQLLDEDAKRAEDILNNLIAVYNNKIINEKNLLATNTLAFMDQFLNKVAFEMDSIEGRMQNYKSVNGAIDISTQGKLFLENVSSNDQKLSDINIQLAILDQIENYVYARNSSGTKIVPSTLGINDAILPSLLNKLYDSELEYEKLKNTEGQNSPALLAVADQIQKIKPGILENVENQKRSLEASKSNLATTNNRYSSFLQGIPQKEREILAINRSQSIKSNIYNTLLQKREETSLSYASSGADSRVVDMAEASLYPVSPKAKLIYFMAFVLSIFLTALFATVNEMFNGKILSRNQIESLTPFAIVGEIMCQKKQAPIVIGKGQKTLIAEQFRKLRFGLDFQSSNSPRKIAVTSSIAGEGKSFIASNLAMSLAIAHKKVILLDMDLYKPSSAAKFAGEKSRNGLVDYLQGKQELKDIIKVSEQYKNLYYIPVGKLLPESPTELLMNGRLKSLMTELGAEFDYVIIDTPPVGAVTDASIISFYCDSTLYVVRQNYTPRVFIDRLAANNKINKLKQPLIIFNAIKNRGLSKYVFSNSYNPEKYVRQEYESSMVV